MVCAFCFVLSSHPQYLIVGVTWTHKTGNCRVCPDSVVFMEVLRNQNMCKC